MSSRRVFRLVFALLVPSIAIACGSDDDDGNSKPSCTPGQSIACKGPGACSGFQVCNAKGTGYDACACGSTGGSSSIGSGGTSSIGGSSSSGSGGTTANGGAGTCTPSDVSTFTPKYVPARPKQTVCAPEDVTDYFTRKCQQGSCPEYLDGGAKVACGKCLAPSPVTDTSFGPIVTLSLGDVTSFETNSAGCVEIAGERPCAEKIQAAQECGRTSCVATCRPTTSAEYDQYTACQTAARASVCKKFTDQTACLGAKSVQLCNGSDAFITLGKAFCSPP